MTSAFAVEYKLQGIVDVRATSTDSLTSYLAGGQGKFGTSDGSQFSLAQAGVQLAIDWDNGLSAHSIINAYYTEMAENNNDSVIGFTEAYVKYRSLPNDFGYRWQTKLGIFYPEISLENNAYAWASKNTLNSSSLNTWIGEEVRVLGGELKLTRLGKLTNNKYDLSVSSSLFTNNDPSGALLAWHGWTMSSRQTLWTEKRAFPWFPARDPGGDLAGQADKSDPFLEVDHKVGYHVRAEWKLHRQGELSVGYYNNRAVPYKVIEGQYGWHTRFYHLGAKWQLNKNLVLIAQYLNGDTLMQSHKGVDVVNNSYTNGFVALTYKWGDFALSKQHKSTIRLEDFSVDDNDQTLGDDNNENGQALTLNHSYRVNKQWFLSTEFIYIDSHRPARYYTHQAVELVEKQVQLAARYFF
jgi:hypothetical protein